MAQRKLQGLSASQKHEVVKNFIMEQIRSSLLADCNLSDLSCFEEIGFDTLDLVMLIYDLEQEFEIFFQEQDLDSVKTIADLINVTIKSINQ